MDKILNKLEIYDFFGITIPGVIVLITFNFTLREVWDKALFNVNDSNIMKIIIFIIASYYVGTIMHEISEMMVRILKLLWGGMPSERFLLKKDEFYTDETKDTYSKIIEELFKVKITGDNKKQNQEAFNLLYSKIQSSKYNDQIKLFNALYGMYRNFLAGTFACFLLFAFSTFMKCTNNTPNDYTWNFTIALVSLAATFILIRRTKRFSERFADYVFRSSYLAFNDNSKS